MPAVQAGLHFLSFILININMRGVTFGANVPIARESSMDHGKNGGGETLREAAFRC